MRKICLLIICFTLTILVGNLSLSPLVQAQTKSNFHTAVTSTYQINSQGTTTVTHHFKLTNKTPTVYISQYGLKITSLSQISQIEGKSQGKPIPVHSVVNDNVTSLAIDFTEPLVGEGKTRDFTISYQDQDTAILSGKVLELHVPQIGDADKYDQIQQIIQVPAEFGEPTRVTPQPTNNQLLGEHRTLTFTNNRDQAISAWFGKQQHFQVQLDYHLHNPHQNPALAQVALPPDTAWQQVSIAGLTPQPKKIEPDSDGNWLATFEIPPQSQQLVKFRGQIIVSLEPQFTSLTPSPNHQYTQALDYWQLSSRELKQVATDQPDLKGLYDFVVDHLSYQIPTPGSVPERLGAEKAWQQPLIATCQEFTDLFIGLARAKKVPTRRLTGYALTNNRTLRPVNFQEDILHAWPEYFDAERKTWIPVDPTWEKTTGGIDYFHQFDLNHLVFAINGSSSTSPFPGGSYKLPDENTKDVEVSIAATPASVTPQFKLDIKPKKILNWAIPGVHELALENQTGRAWYELELNVASTTGQPVVQEQLPYLLPFQTHTQTVTVYTNEWLRGQSLELTADLKLNNVDETYQLNSYHLSQAAKIWRLSHQVYTWVGLGIVCVSLALLTGSLLVYRRR